MESFWRKTVTAEELVNAEGAHHLMWSHAGLADAAYPHIKNVVLESDLDQRRMEWNLRVYVDSAGWTGRKSS